MVTYQYKSSEELENHRCHHHEVFYDDLTGVLCCEICREAKLAKYYFDKAEEELDKQPISERIQCLKCDNVYFETELTTDVCPFCGNADKEETVYLRE